MVTTMSKTIDTKIPSGAGITHQQFTNPNDWRDTSYQNALAKRIEAGEKLYVYYRRDGARFGSIGRIQSIRTRTDKTYTGPNHSWGGQSYWDLQRDPKNWKEVTRADAIIVEWDDRKTTNEFEPHYCTVLEGFTGPTRFNYVTNAGAERVIPTDRLGNDIEVGQTIVFFNRRGDKCLRFGVVSKVTKAGMVYVKDFKLEDDEYSSERRIMYASSDCAVLSGDVLDQLMLKKLSVL